MSWNLNPRSCKDKYLAIVFLFVAIVSVSTTFFFVIKYLECRAELRLWISYEAVTTARHRFSEGNTNLLRQDLLGESAVGIVGILTNAPNETRILFISEYNNTLHNLQKHRLH